MAPENEELSAGAQPAAAEQPESDAALASATAEEPISWIEHAKAENDIPQSWFEGVQTIGSDLNESAGRYGFKQAVKLLKQGCRVRRLCWPKNAAIEVRSNSLLQVDTGKTGSEGDVGYISLSDFDLRSADWINADAPQTGAPS
jgi:hypothetical protein